MKPYYDTILEFLGNKFPSPHQISRSKWHLFAF